MPWPLLTPEELERIARRHNEMMTTVGRVHERDSETMEGFPSSGEMIIELCQALGLPPPTERGEALEAWERALTEVRRLVPAKN